MLIYMTYDIVSMNNTKYNPRFKTFKQCQNILDNPISNQSDKNTAISRIDDIKKWLETKNQPTKKSNSSFDESAKKEMDQENRIIGMAHSIVTKRYPHMGQNDGVFGQIVNATANRILEIRKVNAICKLAQMQEMIVD